jgi:hypothetical protein
LASYFLSQGKRIRIISPKWFVDYTKDMQSWEKRNPDTSLLTI